MEIIGHKSIIEYFKNLLMADQLSHAYLFIGPEHLGKHHVANWLVHFILCNGTDQNQLFDSSGESEKPCRVCESCQALEKSLHPDCFRLESQDTKHQISIEQIRNLQRNLQQAPVISPNTVALIDNAHELSISASNALLKTLEEPTSTSLLFLISHQPHKLPSTIKSRCQIIEFSKVFEWPGIKKQDEAWDFANGLPGVYLNLKGSDSKLQELKNEQEIFLNIINQSKGERLHAVEKWFKSSTKKHKENKDNWYQRLNIWKNTLRGFAMLQLGIGPNSATGLLNPSKIGLKNIVAAIDGIEIVKDRIQKNANIRVQIEFFLCNHLV